MEYLTQITNFLALRGHRPPAVDGLYPLADRLPQRKRIAFLSISTSAIRTASVALNGGKLAVSQVEQATLEPNTPPHSHPLFRDLKRKTNCGMVVLQIGDTEHLQNLASVRKSVPLAEVLALAHDAKSILGQSEQAEFRYGMFSHATSAISMLVGVDRNLVESACSRLQAAGLTVVRAQSSAMALMTIGLADPRVLAGKADLLIFDHGNAIFVPVGDQGLWSGVRQRRGALLRDAETMQVELASLLDERTSREIVVVDSQTHPAVDLALIPQAALVVVEGYAPEHLSIVASFLDRAEVGKNFGIPNILRGLAHELRPVDTEPSALMPPWSKFAAIGFFCVMAAVLLGFGYLKHMKSAKEREILSLMGKKAPAMAAMTADQQAIEALKKRGELAKQLRTWLERNSGLQPLLVELVTSFDARMRVNYLSLKSIDEAESTASHRLNITFSAPQQAVPVAIRDLKAAAVRAGWEIIPQAQGQTNGLHTLDAFIRRIPASRHNQPTPTDQ